MKIILMKIIILMKWNENRNINNEIILMKMILMK